MKALPTTGLARRMRAGLGVLALACLVLAAAALLLSARYAAAGRPQQGELPQACTSANPFFATTCFVRGETYDSDPAVVAFNDSPDNTGHYVLATVGEIGAVYGLASDPNLDLLYAGAFHKRNSKFGPLGPGGVYKVEVNGGGVEPFFTVPNAGRDWHDPEDDYQPDELSRAYAGKTSLGDLDVNSDGSELFVMNLNDKKIYRYQLPEGTPLGSFDTGAARASWVREARPFALKYHEGWLYHGLVRSGERVQSNANLTAYVYASRTDGSAMREVARIWLGYERVDWPGWNPWPDEEDQGRFVSRHPHPILADIEFTDSLDMILGLRDRYIDTGPSLTEGYRRAPGDVLLAKKTGDLAWEHDHRDPEFYHQDELPPNFSELAIGGLARVATRDVVVSSAINPERTYSDGALWFDNVTGDTVGREELLYNRLRHEGPQGKAQGLGDLELVCYTPPTPTPTPVVTVTATPVATGTPTPDHFRAYLPWGEHDDVCVPNALYADVVLVLDRSTSMLRSVEEGGIAKNEAAIAAAHAFVDRLSFTPDANGRYDQVAVVGFNDLSWTELNLSADPQAVHRALTEIGTKTQEGTRLDLAILEGQKPLDGPNRKPDNRPVIILLTDGLPNRVPTPIAGGLQEDTVVAAAAEVKAKGTNVYTIGLGKPTDILPRLLIGMASEWSNYYYAPRPEDLDAIYDRIAQSFADCAPEPHPTPTRCIPDESHTDVVLVLDMSTSMYRETSAGRTKHEAALEAAATFVGLLDLEPDGWGRHDQVAIVGFNDDAWVHTPLTHEREIVLAELPRLIDRVREGTRLDLAFARGQEVLESNRRLLQNRPVLVLLTDGIPNRVPTPVPGGSPEDTVLALAGRAKDAGTVIFTIGLGMPEDIVAWMLEAAASDPSRYFYAPDGEDLTAIYTQIAGRVRDCAAVP